MPAYASFNELKKTEEAFKIFKNKHPNESEDLIGILGQHKMCGYSNFCQMFIEKETPESLKYNSGKAGY